MTIACIGGVAALLVLTDSKRPMSTTWMAVLVVSFAVVVSYVVASLARRKNRLP